MRRLIPSQAVRAVWAVFSGFILIGLNLTVAGSSSAQSENVERIDAARQAVLGLGMDPSCFEYTIVYGTFLTGFGHQPQAGVNRAVKLTPRHCEDAYPVWHERAGDRFVNWDLADGPQTAHQQAVIKKAFRWYRETKGKAARDPETLVLYVTEGSNYTIEFVPAELAWRTDILVHAPMLVMSKRELRILAP
jgi:hypothetical protein